MTWVLGCRLYTYRLCLQPVTEITQRLHLSMFHYIIQILQTMEILVAVRRAKKATMNFPRSTIMWRTLVPESLSERATGLA